MTQTILHLVDDLTPGGITRFLDHLKTLPCLNSHWQQQRIVIERGRWTAPTLSADLIVSHLSISWRNLPMLLALRAKHPSTPILHVEHTYTAGFLALEVHHPQRFKTLLRTAFALFDHVVAVSEAQHNWFVHADLVRDGRHSVISPSVNLAPFLALPPPTKSGLHIGVVGRLDFPKGVDVLIRAFQVAAPKNATLSVSGEGAELPRLKALAGKDARINFEGQTDPVEAMRRCNVIAIPSRRESYGLVALEARAAGRTLLVSGVDGLKDHARQDAVLVGQDAQDWQRALARLSMLHEASTPLKARATAAQDAEHSAREWQILLRRFSTKAPEVLTA